MKVGCHVFDLSTSINVSMTARQCVDEVDMNVRMVYVCGCVFVCVCECVCIRMHACVCVRLLHVYRLACKSSNGL